MTWLNPVAFVGLVALAVPILLHLFGRRVARRIRFSSLRLFEQVQPTPATRNRPSDLLLLVVRCAVVTAAVAALAQPSWSGPQPHASRPVRLILVDTSASMMRLTSTGDTPMTLATRQARVLLDSSSRGMIVEVARPGPAIAGAASWLSAQSGLRELVVVSDFQAGSVADGHLAGLGDGIGLRFIRVPFVTSGDTGARYAPRPGATDAAWPAGARAAGAVPIAAGPGSAAAVDAAREAARSLDAGIRAGERTVVVFSDAPERAALAGTVARAATTGVADLALALHGDDALSALARGAEPVAGCAAPGIVIARAASGAPVVSVASLAPGGEFDAAIFSCVDPRHVLNAAVVRGASNAAPHGAGALELDPVTLPDEQLRAWERPPSGVGPRGRDETSPDARWVWLAVVGLILIEEWLRRRAPRRALSPVAQARHDRAA